MSLDGARALFAKATILLPTAAGVKQSRVSVDNTVGGVALALDAKTVSVALSNQGAETVYLAMDGTAADATKWPIASGAGETFDIQGGNTLKLFTVGAGPSLVHVIEVKQA